MWTIRNIYYNPGNWQRLYVYFFRQTVHYVVNLQFLQKLSLKCMETTDLFYFYIPVWQTIFSNEYYVYIPTLISQTPILAQLDNAWGKLGICYSKSPSHLPWTQIEMERRTLLDKNFVHSVSKMWTHQISSDPPTKLTPTPDLHNVIY